MGLGIYLFRTPEGQALVKESQKRRGQSPDVVDQVIALDDQVRVLRFQFSKIRQEMKQNQAKIAVQKKAQKTKPDQFDAEKLAEIIQANKELAEQLKQNQADEKDLTEQIEQLVLSVGNLVHDDVPISETEDKNRVDRTWTNQEALYLPDQQSSDLVDQIVPHHQLLERIGGYDQMRGVKIIGHRGYFLTGAGFLLNQALQRYALDFLLQRKYQPIQPPYLMKADMMAKTAELADFNETLYSLKSVDQQSDHKTDHNQAFLIATSEQPISAFHADETLEPEQLPLRYAGFSTCFRKEAGAHGKETWGVFRVHQFEKVEQFVLTDVNNSAQILQEMLKTAEEFYQSLGLSYRVVSIVSGALNNAASQKYDLEAWFPSYGEYKELVSCSNCTDYQARALNIKVNGPLSENQSTKFVHLLNGTLCATERTMCCLLENYQTPEGIMIPEVLKPYLTPYYVKYLPYLN